MELFQLKYFWEVIKCGGVQAASRQLHVSPPAISKAISNLESELNVLLFDRKNRSLVLTEKGKHLQKKAGQILAMAEETRLELTGTAELDEVVIAGREIFLEHYGILIASHLRKTFPKTTVHFLGMSGEEAQLAVRQGKAHLALSIQPPPTNWKQVSFRGIRSVVVANAHHPLAKLARKGNSIPIQKLLEYPFISPNLPLYGRIRAPTSIDGWQDDVLPRKISYLVESINIYRELIDGGHGLGYVPDFWARKIGAVQIPISDHKFKNVYTLFCSSSRGGEIGWLSRLLEEIGEHNSSG